MKVIGEQNHAFAFLFFQDHGSWKLTPLLIIECLLLYVSRPSRLSVRLSLSIRCPINMGHQVAFVSIYRLTLHPLAKYPGPLLGRLSGWAIVIQAASGNRHLESWKEHETYGKSFDSLIAVVSNVKENQVPSSASAQTPYPSIPSQPYEKSTAPANPTLKK